MEEINESTAVILSKPHTQGIQRKDFFDASPQEQVAQATEIANALSSVIEKQKLYSVISGKKYIKAEGWQTLGTLLGVVPREKSVIRHDDGTYEAYVEIVKYRDGVVVGGGSAICSRKERRWSGADEYAVRSMAITRATGKAFRVGFSWIVTLKGYSPTPEEEMPGEASEEKGDEQTLDITDTKKGIYTGTEEEQKTLTTWLAESHPDIPDSQYFEIHEKYKGRPKKDILKILKEVCK